MTAHTTLIQGSVHTVHGRFQEGSQRGMAYKNWFKMRTKPITATVNIPNMRQRYEVSRAMTVVRTPIRTALIPVTVGTFET